MKKQKIPKDNYIYTYYQQIEDGSICVGRWIRLIYEYLIKGLEQKEFFFDQKKADAVIEYFEWHCFHTEGVKAPNELKLELWQKAMLSAMFGIVDKDGNRQFREVVLIVARKNGKSLIGAGTAKYVFEKDGGFGARVYCIAPKLEQADIVYNDIWQMIQLDPDWQELKREIENSKDAHNKKTLDDSVLAKHRQSDLYLQATNSTVKKIAFSAKKSDGFNPSLVICDEIASWQGDQGLKQYEVLKSGMGARPEGMMLSCSTAGYIHDGIYDELVKRSTRFLLGNSKEKRLLPFLYMIDDIEKWNDINELRKSNPNLSVSIPVDYLLEEIAIAEGSLSKKAEFLTKYCNIKQNSSQAWLPADKVAACSGAPIDLNDFRNCYAICGIDLSQTTDLTAVCCVIERDGIFNVVAQFYLPAEKLAEATARDGLPYQLYVERGLLKLSGENYVDYKDCYQWLTDLIEKYKIYPLQTGYDRYSAQYLIKELEQYGFHCQDVYQGYNLTPVINEFEGILKDGRINLGDNDLLKIHLLNTALQMDSGSEKKKIVKIAPTDHIDGCAALLDAFTVRMHDYDEIGAQLRNER